MKETFQRPRYPRCGDERTVSRFLLLPRTEPKPDGTCERRWLERAFVRERLVLGFHNAGLPHLSWEFLGFSGGPEEYIAKGTGHPDAASEFVSRIC